MSKSLTISDTAHKYLTNMKVKLGCRTFSETIYALALTMDKIVDGGIKEVKEEINEKEK